MPVDPVIDAIARVPIATTPFLCGLRFPGAERLMKEVSTQKTLVAPDLDLARGLATLHRGSTACCAGSPFCPLSQAFPLLLPLSPARHAGVSSRSPIFRIEQGGKPTKRATRPYPHTAQPGAATCARWISPARELRRLVSMCQAQKREDPAVVHARRSCLCLHPR